MLRAENTKAMAAKMNRGFVIAMVLLVLGGIDPKGPPTQSFVGATDGHGQRDMDSATGHANKIELKDILFVVLSQTNIYHARRADIFQQNLEDQADKLEQGAPRLLLLHERWPGIGAWTVLPTLPTIAKEYADKAVVFFCEEETRLNLDKFIKALNNYDFSEDLFLGKALRDREASIIHHFAFHDNPSSFAYPDFAAGFLLSVSLIKRLSTRLSYSIGGNFAIDAKHELAMFIWDKGNGVRLREASFLCTVNPNHLCATSLQTTFPKCGKPVLEDDIFFAVKTCEKFHRDRVPVVLKTWGKDAKHIEFYSEKEDRTIPTINLGVPNTEKGHCAKLMAILHRAHKEDHITSKSWLVIADDDTLISVPRLRRLLACYEPSEPIVLGERYGYGLSSEYTGYDYLTGGSGFVLSRMAVMMLLDSKQCRCGSDDAPDDMTLGMCLKHISIPLTHSPYFHQARPMDYASGFLENQIPVSFHKHWMLDPYQVYKDWLHEDATHDEL